MIVKHTRHFLVSILDFLDPIFLDFIKVAGRINVSRSTSKYINISV